MSGIFKRYLHDTSSHCSSSHSRSKFNLKFSLPNVNIQFPIVNRLSLSAHDRVHLPALDLIHFSTLYLHFHPYVTKIRMGTAGEPSKPAKPSLSRYSPHVLFHLPSWDFRHFSSSLLLCNWVLIRKIKIPGPLSQVTVLTFSISQFFYLEY
jgi:hypothetical protein